MYEEEKMKITVKRKTWFLGRMIPVTLYFHNMEIGKVSASEEKEMKIPAKEGILKYKRFLEKGNQISVENGDYIILKDTLMNKIVNIIFLVWFIIIMTNIFFIENEEIMQKISLIFLVGFIIILISSVFISSHKFIKVK